MNETETLGRYLRRERELRKISLRELSKNTRVREHLLKAIEEDRHDLLPSPTFVKGFLNAYAKYVGLDANEIILRYQRGLSGTPEIGPEVVLEKEPVEKPKHRGVVRASIAGAVIVAGVLVYLLFLQPSEPPEESLHSTPAEMTAEQESQTSSPAPPQIAGTIPAKPQTPVTAASAPSPPQIAGTIPPQKGKTFSLQLKAVELTWVSVKADNLPEREMLLRPGETVPLEALNQIFILVGNAGGLDLIHNGKTLERFGNSGDVVGLAFTPEGVDLKRYEKSKPQ